MSQVDELKKLQVLVLDSRWQEAGLHSGDLSYFLHLNDPMDITICLAEDIAYAFTNMNGDFKVSTIVDEAKTVDEALRRAVRCQIDFFTECRDALSDFCLRDDFCPAERANNEACVEYYEELLKKWADLRPN